MAGDSSVPEIPHVNSHSTRRARGRAWAVRGGIATAVLSVALVAPGVNEYAARQLASLAQPQLAREWYSQTHIPLSDVPPEQGFSRWNLPSALAERSLWRWDDATIQWLDQQAGLLPQALKSLQKLNTVYLLPAMTVRREIKAGDQLFWTLELAEDAKAVPLECGVTYSVGRGTEIALTRACIENRSRASFAKIVHELVHAWDLEQGDKLATPLWDEKRGMWARRSLSTWPEDPLSTWANLSWKMRASPLDWVKRSEAEAFVSRRAELSPMEDLAETAEQYFLDPVRVASIAPRKAAWLKQRLFQPQSVSDSKSWPKK